ncbi:MAG: tRNA (adenosine(37)-N6)-threonylcarbamoyltransferase complex dimerization subunit type 1 TsaB [Defluviitaleaceae bacterium]|nr:tRNA (adenosine(37)-N6)-threonylcarbamoyltransferase complex dimerization subunit type 1 TsaB [Defluviitaleaceae bacterium]
MKLLSIDTSGPTASAALFDGERAAAAASVTGAKKHAEILMPMIENLLDQSGFLLHNLDLIACTAGPGSFTGLRIGAAAAKGLAYALNIPLAAVPTLDAMAYNAVTCNAPGLHGRNACMTVIPMMDARRSQVYTALYELDGGEVRRLTPDMAAGVKDVLAEAAKYGRAALFVGEGAALYRCEILESGLKCAVLPAYGQNIAVCAGLIGLKMAAEGALVSCADFALSYLRKPQAERERLERIERLDRIERIEKTERISIP